MNDRLHELTSEIKTIENILESLSAPMLEVVLEERKNLQFELDILQRKAHNLTNPITQSNADN